MHRLGNLAERDQVDFMGQIYATAESVFGRHGLTACQMRRQCSPQAGRPGRTPSAWPGATRLRSGGPFGLSLTEMSYLRLTATDVDKYDLG
jgi:hypothetical protein